MQTVLSASLVCSPLRSAIDRKETLELQLYLAWERFGKGTDDVAIICMTIKCGEPCIRAHVGKRDKPFADTARAGIPDVKPITVGGSSDEKEEAYTRRFSQETRYG